MIASKLTAEQKARYNTNRLVKRERLKATDPDFYPKEREKVRLARLRRIAKDPAYERIRATDAWLRHTYGITLKQRDELYARIKNCECCGIHHDSLTEGRYPKRRLHIDHRHGEKAVRGLLCFKCNILIGQADEDPEILRKAIAYLKR